MSSPDPDDRSRRTRVGGTEIAYVVRTTETQTYCNFAVQDILRAGGDHTLDRMTASQMTEFLSQPSNAMEITYVKAVAYAKAGVTIIAAERGHVAIVSPDDLVKAGPSWEKAAGETSVPKVFNVGRRNELLALDYAFNRARPPKMYILNGDKKKLDDQK